MQKSLEKHGLPVALRVVTAGPSVEITVTFAGNLRVSRYVPGFTRTVPPDILMAQIAAWILQYGSPWVPVPVPAQSSTHTVVCACVAEEKARAAATMIDANDALPGSIGDLVGTMRRVRAGLNPSLDIEGVLLTMNDERTNLGQQVARDVREFFKEKVYGTVIPRNVRLAEAPSHGMPVLAYDARSRGAEAYSNFAREFRERRQAV